MTAGPAAGGIGHNAGPALAAGRGWQRHCWQQARAELLPHLPLEVLRLRLRRAAEIGLDYRSYATIRATTGHDLVAVLFSTNALRLFRQDQALEAARAARLAAQRGIARDLVAQPPLDAAALVQRLTTQGLPFGVAMPAPQLGDSWSVVSRRLRGALAGAGRPADRVLLIGDTGWERTWAEAGRLAGYLAAERFFGAEGAAVRPTA